VSEFLTDPGDYVNRPGYEPNFLGAEQAVALPTVRGERTSDIANPIGGGVELRFWTYSSVMSRSRRLPFLSAANLDRTTKDSTARPSAWKIDPRLDSDPERSKDLQVTNVWYQHQLPAVARGPFDRGHLTAFEHAAWGADRLRNGVDTFHFTNCAPQASSFNEHEVWREIEVWAAQRGTSGKVSFFSGPIFDAPPSTPLSDDLFKLNPLDPGVPDPVLNGLRVPKQYYKVVAYVEGGKLVAQALIGTQEGYLDAIPTLAPEELSEKELSLYRVPVSVLQRLTGIDFGILESADAMRESAAVSQPIATFADLD